MYKKPTTDYLNFCFLDQLDPTSGKSSSPPLLSALVSLPTSSPPSSLTPSPLPNSIRSPSSSLSFILPNDSSLPPKPKLLVSITATRRFIAWVISHMTSRLSRWALAIFDPSGHSHFTFNVRHEAHE